MKKILLSIILILLLLPIVSASFIGEWGEVQDSSWRTGFVNDAEGVWNTSGITITSSYSSFFQPLVADVDNDTSLEILIGEGDYVTIQSYDDYSIDLDDELDMGSAQSFAYNLLANYDSDVFVEFVAVHTTNFSVLEFNGTNINVECSLTIPTPVQGVACHNKTNLTCYTFDAVGNMSVIDTQACTLQVIDIDSGTNIFSLTDEVQTTPVIVDIDRDGHDEIILGGDQGDNVHEGVYVIDATDLSLDTGFNGGGYVQLPEANSGKAKFSGVAYWNLGADNELFYACRDECAEAYPFGGTLIGFLLGQNIPYNTCLKVCELAYEFNTYGGGYGELIVTSRNYASTSQLADYSYISAYRSSGTAVFNTVLGADGSSNSVEYVGNPVIMVGLLSDEYDDELCVIRYRSGTIPHTYISCVDDTGALIFQDELDLVFNSETDDQYTSSARLGGSMDLMSIGRVFLMDFNTNTTTMVNATETAGGSCIIQDVDQDSLLDVLCGGSTALSLGLSNYVNQPPVINDSLAYGGYGYNYDITQPICVNQSITFTAQEIGGLLTGNYENDVELDFERIVSNCGQLETGVASSSYDDDLLNGSYVKSRPEFSCFYNTTGTFNVRLYLEDLANEGDRTQYNTQTITLSVIDGDVGVDCSFVDVVEVGSVVIPSGADEEDFDAQVDAFFNGIHLKSSKSRNILALLIVCLIGAGIFMKSRSIELAIGGGLIGSIMMVILGIMSILPLVLIVVLCIAFIVMKVLGRGG